MSRALDNLKNAVSNAGDYIDALEVELEDLDQYTDLFDDVHEARDIKDYYEELSNIFDDAYDAERAKDVSEAAGYAGWDDPSDIDEAAEELDQYRRLGSIDELREVNKDELTLLRDRIVELEAQAARGVALEDQRIAALTVLGGKDQVQADIDQIASAERAYENGLSDGILAQAVVSGEQGVVDPETLTDDEA